MRKIGLILTAILLVFTFCLPAQAATQANTMQCFATVSADGSCQVTLTATLHLEQSQDVTFPVPVDATAITVNGSRVRASKVDNTRVISLSRALGNITGDVSVQIGYTLPNVVYTTENETLELRLPLLSGFAYPIAAMEFTVNLPGTYPERPGFSSGYHQADIEKSMTVTLSGNSVHGVFHEALKDRETLSMSVPVEEKMFPRAAAEMQSLDVGITAMLILGALALLYWLLFLRTAPMLPTAQPEPPEGCSAGRVQSALHLMGVDLSMQVLSWAQLGYLHIQVERSGRVLLHKRMDMGNERDDAEWRCFQKLFARRQTVDTAGIAYATFCRDIGENPISSKEFVHKRTGNRKIFRLLLSGVGLFGGACLGFLMGSGAVLQWFLVVLTALVGGIAAYHIATFATTLWLRKRRQRWLCLAIAGAWLLFGVAVGGFVLALGTVAGLVVGSFFYAFAGRRNEYGRLSMRQVLALRRYLRTASQEELSRLSRQNPEYYFTLAPYAIALGVGEKFAKGFGKLRLPPCPYLTAGEDAHMTAIQWHHRMEQTLRAMDARKDNLPLEKLISVLQSLRK